MPTVRSNTIYRCQGCGAVYDFQEWTSYVPCTECGQLAYEAIPVQVVCDFCSRNRERGEVFWTYPCDDFEYPVQLAGQPSEGSKGPWAACDTCHDLIEDGDLHALAGRSVERGLQLHPEMEGKRDELIAITLPTHKAFMRHRTGEAIRENYDQKETDDDGTA